MTVGNALGWLVLGCLAVINAGIFATANLLPKELWFTLCLGVFDFAGLSMAHYWFRRGTPRSY